MTAAATNHKAVVKSITDEKPKREATEVYNRLGMSLSTAINVFQHQSQRVPASKHCCGRNADHPGRPLLLGGKQSRAFGRVEQEKRHEVAASCTASGFDELIADL